MNRSNFYKVHAVSIGDPDTGSNIGSVFKEALELRLDFIVFNKRLIPVSTETDLADYLKRFPEFTKPKDWK